MLLAQGLDIKRSVSVLAFGVGYAAAELRPVYLRLASYALNLLEPLSRHRAMRQIRRLQGHCRPSTRCRDHTCLLLGASATKFLDIAKEATLRCQRSAWTHRGLQKTICGHSAGARRAVRQSKPLVLALRLWLGLQLTRVSGKALIADAIHYALHHPDGLNPLPRRRSHRARYYGVERGIRPIVLKKAPFASHDEGRRLDLPSLIETCKLNGVDP
jgi:hypothetical protein